MARKIPRPPGLFVTNKLCLQILIYELSLQILNFCIYIYENLLAYLDEVPPTPPPGSFMTYENFLFKHINKKVESILFCKFQILHKWLLPPVDLCIVFNDIVGRILTCCAKISQLRLVCDFHCDFAHQCLEKKICTMFFFRTLVYEFGHQSFFFLKKKTLLPLALKKCP